MRAIAALTMFVATTGAAPAGAVLMMIVRWIFL
jgi:hypothetical protein